MSPPPTAKERPPTASQQVSQPAPSRNFPEKKKQSNHEKADFHYVYNGFSIKTIKMLFKT